MQIQRIERYDVFENSFQTSRNYHNPYTEVEATAEFIRPDRNVWKIPLFYDGGEAWKVRISPDLVGTWSYEIISSDPGLNGLKGIFECVSSSRHGGIMPMKDYPYHFQYQDGTLFWFFGDSCWRIFAHDELENHTRSTVLHYIDVRAEQGFNYIHTELTGYDTDGYGIFRNFSTEEINPSFFKEIDYRIQYMNSKGITCGIFLAWARRSFSWENSVFDWESYPSDAARLRYALYVAARYSAYNVVFLVAGEWDLGDINKRTLYQIIGNEIMKHDPHNRMRGIHPCRPQSTAEFALDPWVSFGDYQQAYQAPHESEATAADRNALQRYLLKSKINSKPVVNSEYAYYLRHMGNDAHNYNRPRGRIVEGVDKPHSHSRTSFRRASWVLAMVGGYFVSGFGTTYWGGWADEGPFDVDAPKNDEAETDLMNIRRFLTSIEWWKLESTDFLVKSGSQGYSYCLSEIGRTYVVYSEGNDYVTLSLGDAPSGTYSIKLYDPRTGKYTDLPRHVGSGPINLSGPDIGDWAFIVTRKDAF